MTVNPRLVLLLFGLTVASTQSLGAQAAPLSIRYLGNMGVVVEAGGRRVVFDGFHRGELKDYARIPPALLGPLESAADPFRSIDVAFTTHRHLDHFAATSAAARLRADPKLEYVAPADVIDSIVSRGIIRSPKLHGMVPPEGGRIAGTIAGLAVTALDLPHNATRRTPPPNVGYLVEVAGFRILHVGDANPDVASYAPHRLGAERIDVAFLPYWYLTDDGAIARSIGARQVVAIHVGPADAAEVVAKVRRRFPGAIVLTVPGERKEVPAR